MKDIAMMADRILSVAAKAHASDVYIEPNGEAHFRLRFRIGGTLQTVQSLKQSDYFALLTRFKTLSGMDIGNRLILQDGAFIFYGKNKDQAVNVRVSCVPTDFGEHLVLRLFDKQLYTRKFSALGMTTGDVLKIEAMLKRKNGLILVTGPTGAGKSSTCYAMLHQLNQDNRHIITLEDPVEVYLPGVTQIQINEKQNVTFATGLRAILRQDPDVIFIGEIRDNAAAVAAMQAALTGHLVISTMHTKDVQSTTKRLSRFGIDEHDVKEALIGIVSQKLINIQGRRRTGVFEIASHFKDEKSTIKPFGSMVAERKAAPYEANQANRMAD